MGITDLFRPKWKHSDAEVRAAAVRSLPSDEISTLASVAQNDSDAAVRRIAIKKLADAQLLCAIARSDPDESLRQLAKDKADTLLLGTALAETDREASQTALAQLHEPSAIAEVAKCAAQEVLRQTALERLTDPRALAEVARHAKDPQIRLGALQHLDDQTLLRAVVLAEETKEVALAALERLSDPEALEAVAKKHRIKSIRSRAGRKLKDATPAAPAPQRSEPALSEGRPPDQLELICRTVETLARSSAWQTAAKQLAAAQESWQPLAAEANPELQRRFAAACADFQGRYERHQEEQAARAEQEKALQQQLAERAAFCEQVEALKEPAAAEQLTALRARWQMLPPLPEAQQAVIEQRFARACELVERRQADAQRQQALHEQLAAICAEAEQLAAAEKVKPALLQLKELRGRWQALTRRQEAPAELQGRLEQIQRQLEEREAQQVAALEQRLQQSLKRQETFCQKVEGLTGNGDLKQVDRALKEVQDALRRPERLPQKEQEDAVRQRLQAVREQLAARAQELRQTEDWKRWANVPQLEALCEQATALLKEPDLGKAAARLRQVQAEWRKAGAVPKDKSQQLWESFKATCDQVYERCKEHLEQQEEGRQQSLQQKEALCAQVEALAASTDWEATAEEIKRLQAEWKATGPVPRKQSDAVWKRFRQACDAFFERRKEHLDQAGGARQENLSKKEALCERVEALVDSTSWEATANEIKQLQAEWKAIGPVPRKQSDAVWKRFRHACDAFFARRQEHQEQGLKANLERKEALISRLAALIGAPAAGEDGQPAQPDAAGQEAGSGDDPLEAVRAARNEWKAIGQVPRSQADALWERFNAACAALAESHPEAFTGSELDPLANLRRLEQLVRKAESFTEHEVTGPDDHSKPESVEQMAAQLRQALQANALGASVVSTVDWRLAAEEIKQLQSDLRRLGPVPPETAAPLLARFRGACSRVLDRSGDNNRSEGNNPAEDERQQQNLKRKQELCDQAVKLASSSTPAAHLALIESLAREWERIGPVPRGKGKTLWNRFRQACGTVREAAHPAARATQAEAAEPQAEQEHVQEHVQEQEQEANTPPPPKAAASADQNSRD